MSQEFSATVNKWVLESQRKLLAVFKTAVQSTMEEVQDRTPVDTGYLRATLTASITGPITDLTKNPVTGHNPGDPPVYTKPFNNYAFVIAGAELGDTIYGGFTANYAVYVEYGAQGRTGVGMVRLAAQNWQKNVDRAVAQLRRT